MTLTTIILIFALMLNSAIVYLVYRSNPRRLSNRIFAFLGINIGLWNLAFIFIINATTTQMASAWIRVTFILGSFVPLCFVALTYSIGEKKLEFLKKKGFQVVVLLSLIALFVSLLPNFFLDITEPGRAIQQVPHATYGWPFFVFFVLFLSGNIYGFIILIKKLKLRKGMARAELEYMIAGELFALFFVFFCNFLYPVLFKSSFLVQFSPLGVLIMNGIIGYGIAKYRILDISVVMEKTLSYSMVILFMFILYNMSAGLFKLLISSHLSSQSVLPDVLSLLVIIFAFEPSRRKINNFVKVGIFKQEYLPEDLLAGLEKVLYTVGNVKEFLKICLKIILKEIEINRGMVIFIKDERQKVDFYTEYSFDDSAGKQDNQQAIEYPQAMSDYMKNSRHFLIKDEIERRIPIPEYSSIIGEMEALNIEVAIPLFDESKLFGILGFGEKLSGKLYTSEDEKIFLRLSYYISIKVRNFILYEQLERAKVYQDSLLANLPIGVIGIDQNREITVANREFEKITMLAGERLANMPFEEVLPEEIKNILSYTLKNREGVQNLQCHLKKNEAELSLVANSSIFFDREEKLFGAQVILSDVTRVKELEESVRRADRLASLGIMAAGIAHEIKNPLVSIKTFAQLIPDKYDDKEFRDTFSELTLKEVNRINNLIEQILLFSKPRAAVISNVNLVSLLKTTLLLISSQVKEKNIRVREAYPASEIVIKGDEEKLKQAFLNVFINSVEAEDSEGFIDLEVRKDNNIIKVEIKDNGCGIKKDIIDKIFEPFFTTKQKGTGLGLAIVIRIIEEHGGKIKVSSMEGKGTSVFIEIPENGEREH